MTTTYDDDDSIADIGAFISNLDAEDGDEDEEISNGSFRPALNQMSGDAFAALGRMRTKTRRKRDKLEKSFTSSWGTSSMNSSSSVGGKPEGSKLAKNRKKSGKCEKCGMVRTHEVSILGKRRAMTVEGLVYKGICLSCNTLFDAKSKLGEMPHPNDMTIGGNIKEKSAKDKGSHRTRRQRQNASFNSCSSSERGSASLHFSTEEDMSTLITAKCTPVIDAHVGDNARKEIPKADTSKDHLSQMMENTDLKTKQQHKFLNSTVKSEQLTMELNKEQIGKTTQPLQQDIGNNSPSDLTNRIYSFDDRIKRKIEEMNVSTGNDTDERSSKSPPKALPTAGASRIRTYDEKVKRKIDGEAKQRATPQAGKDNGTSQSAFLSQGATRVRTYDERIKKKLEGEAQAENKTYSNPSRLVSPTVGATRVRKYDERIKKKLEGETSGLQVNATKPFQSEKNTNRSDDGSPPNLVSPAIGATRVRTYDERIKKKLEAEVQPQPSPTSDSTNEKNANEDVGTKTQSANSPLTRTYRFGQTNLSDGQEKGSKEAATVRDNNSASIKTTTDSPSVLAKHADRYEDRLKSITAGEEPSQSVTISSNSASADPASKKIEKDAQERNKGGSYSSGSTFEKRLRKKLAESNQDHINAPVASSSPNDSISKKIEKEAQERSRGNGARSGSTFDERLRKKMTKDDQHQANDPMHKKVESKTKEQSTQNGIRSGSTFDDRLRRKLAGGDKDQTEPPAAHSATSDSTRKTSEREAKEQRKRNGIHSGSTFEERLRRKLDGEDKDGTKGGVGNDQNKNRDEKNTKKKSLESPHTYARNNNTFEDRLKKKMLGESQNISDRTDSKANGPSKVAQSDSMKTNHKMRLLKEQRERGQANTLVRRTYSERLRLKLKMGAELHKAQEQARLGKDPIQDSNRHSDDDDRKNSFFDANAQDFISAINNMKSKSDPETLSRIFNFFENHTNAHPKYIIGVLEILRECLTVFYFNGIQISDELDLNTWLEAFQNLLQLQSQSKERYDKSFLMVQREVLFTLWSFVATNREQARLIMESNADIVVNLIVDAMYVVMENEAAADEGELSISDVVRDLFECVTGLIISLSSTSKGQHAKHLCKSRNGEIIKGLVCILSFEKGAFSLTGLVQSQALKALYYIAAASLKTSFTSSHPTITSSAPSFSTASLLLGVLMEGSNESNVSENEKEESVLALLVMEDIQKAMHNFPHSVDVNLWACRLVWAIFPSASSAMKSSHITAIKQNLSQFVDDLLPHLQSAIKINDGSSLALQESAICLLSKITSWNSGSVVTDIEAMVALINQLMRHHPKSWIFALHGCRCISDLCRINSKSSQARSIIEQGDDTISAILTCMASLKGHIPIQSQACEALAALCIDSPVNKKATIDLGGIDALWSAFEVFERASLFNEQCLDGCVRVCTALLTLALDSMGAEAISKSDSIAKIKRYAYPTTSSGQIPETLQQMMRDICALGHSSSEGSLSFPFNDLHNDEHALSDCLYSNLKAITEEGGSISVDDTLRINVLKTMTMFPTNAEIQENSCKILACIYADDSYEATSLTRDAETITESLGYHKATPKVVAAACSALKNFFLTCSASLQDDPPDAVDTLLTHCIAKVMEAMNAHYGVLEVQQIATGALWALCNVNNLLCENVSLDSCITLILDMMERFPASAELKRNSIGVLWIFFSSSEDTINFVTDQCVRTIIKFIDANERDEDVIDIALGILCVISSNLAAIEVLLRNGSVLRCIVTCMAKFPLSPSIQGAACDILRNLSQDTYIQNDVCYGGGISKVALALSQLPFDRLFVTKALESISNLISGSNISILQSEENDTLMYVLNAMFLHSDDVYIQIKGTIALWNLATRHEMFKKRIIEQNGVKLISDALTNFVGSEKMQEYGFVTLWHLASGPMPEDVVKMAAVPISNGMAAHFDSRELCESGLGALNYLCLQPSAKLVLIANGVVDLVVNCMWMHHEYPSLQKIALNTLVSVSGDTELDRVLVFSKEEFDAIINAMNMYPSVKEIQESSLILLRNCVQSPTNLRILRSFEALTSLVNLAGREFSDLSSRATFVLMRI